MDFPKAAEHYRTGLLLAQDYEMHTNKMECRSKQNLIKRIQ